MATLQQRNLTFRILFKWQGKRCTLPIGKVSQSEAEAKCSQVEYLLMRLNQRLIQVPDHCDLLTFLQFDGHPPQEVKPLPAARKEQLTLGELRRRYFETYGSSLEASTLSTIRTHFDHLEKTFGASAALNELTLVELQKHVDRRAKQKTRNGLVTATTIRKDLISLRGAWNWAHTLSLMPERFCMRGLRFPKLDEKLPFMTREEIERHLAVGGDHDALWECLFLTTEEIREVLQIVKLRSKHGFLYPMVYFAAHTGARRSELIRAQLMDIDVKGGTVLIREKKRVQGKRTTRRVPLTPALAEVIEEWRRVHPGGPFLFAMEKALPRSQKVREANLAPTKSEAHNHFKRVLKSTPWQILRGWHVLRHSFISACVMKGLDQRLIDTWVGHSTDEQRKRYTHLYPRKEREAIHNVFS